MCMEYQRFEYISRPIQTNDVLVVVILRQGQVE